MIRQTVASKSQRSSYEKTQHKALESPSAESLSADGAAGSGASDGTSSTSGGGKTKKERLAVAIAAFRKYSKFIGGGAFICTSYIDPGNYSTDVQAGAKFRFHLLFVIFLSNMIAIFLQSLAIKLGTVTGRDLAQISRDELPRWLNLVLYVFAEIAIIATDIAEVVGTAVALNILFHIPLVAGVVITIVDVLVVLLAYRNEKSAWLIRYFEYGVAVLVLAVAVCFAIQLANIPPMPAGEVFRGFLPSRYLFDDGAMYASCGILGATVMPHSLYLGSSIVKPRVVERDVDLGNMPPNFTAQEFEEYKPSTSAINYCLKFSIIELAVSLCTLAFFVNASILIVAGATLYGTEADSADLFSIHQSMSELISRGAGTLFMISLLLSGQSAGIVCTIAGQVVSEGYLDWNVKRAWIRRIVTRAIAILPCLIVTASVGRSGLGQVLNASQAALSILLPFLVLPLIYFTCKPSIMCVEVDPYTPQGQNGEPAPIALDEKNAVSVSVGVVEEQPQTRRANYTNGWVTIVVGALVWIFITVLNIYLIIQLGMGN